MMHAKNNMTYLTSIFTRDITPEYIHHIRENGFTKDIRWIKAAAKVGRIRLDGAWYDSWYGNYCEQMTMIVDALNVAHGDNWDMEVYPWFIGSKTYFSLRPVILYPHLTLLNSRGRTEEIYDLLMSFTLTSNDAFSALNFNINIRDIIGTRLTYQYSHFSFGYVHSHLTLQPQNNSNNSLQFQGYCTGGDTEIDDIMSEIGANGFEEGMFGLFVTMLDTLVSWESLEGVPYNKMSSIVVPQIESKSFMDNSLAKSHYSNMATELTHLNYEYVLNNGKYRIKRNESLKEQFKELIIGRANNEEWKHLLVKKKQSDYYGFIMNNSIMGIEDTRRNASYQIPTADGSYQYELPYIFIGKLKRELTIHPFEGEIADINDYNIHPKFLNYVTKQLEKSLYQKAIRYSVIERITD